MKESMATLTSKVKILKKWESEYRRPLSVNDVASVNQLTFLVKQFITLFPALGSKEPINWLEGWGAFSFDPSLSPEEIEDIKHNTEIIVRGTLQEVDQANGAHHQIFFNWVQHSQFVYTLEAYLNPPADHKPGPGGGGTGVISPTPPQQPPPPPLSA